MDVQVERSGGTAVVRLQGDVVVGTTPSLYRCLRALARRRDVRQVVVDFGDAGRLDTSGVAAVSLGSRLMARAGKGFDLAHLDDAHQAAFELLPQLSDAPPAAPPPERLEALGESVLRAVDRASELVELLWSSARAAVAVLLRRGRLPEGAFTTQALAMGFDGLPIIGLLSALIGMTLAFQGAVQLEQFGADVFVADLVGLAVVREFAPMMTAIILTGRTGAAIAAELGTMRVHDEVDALRAMGIAPVRFLVLPRLLALTLAQPALTLVAMFVGVAGGMVIGVTVIDMAPSAFWARVSMRVEMNDLLHGLSKSFVFAWIIGVVACFNGLRAHGGPQAVGHATTRTVVTSVFLIIVVDAAFATVSAMGGR